MTRPRPTDPTQAPRPDDPIPADAGPAPHREILLASAPSIVEPSGGAVATLDALRGLAAGGFASLAFSASGLAPPGGVPLE